MGLLRRIQLRGIGPDGQGESGGRLICSRVRADQVKRGGVERVGEAAQGWGPRLGAQGLQPDQGVTAEAGAVGQLLLGQGGLEATAPETAEGDHGGRQSMVVSMAGAAPQFTLDVIFMTTSMVSRRRLIGGAPWRGDAEGTPRGRPRPQTGPAMTDTEGPAHGAR